MVWSALILGLISSLHCFGMCAPLQVMALGAPSKNVKYTQIMLYHVSRILTYALLGALAGILGKGLGLQRWQQETSLLSGLLLLFAFTGFYLLKLDKRLLKAFFPYLSRMRGILQKNKQAKVLYFIGSGVLNGLLPCGMVYLALFPAIGSEIWWHAMVYMLIFGVGTLPVLIVANLGGLRFLQFRSSLIHKLIPLFILTTALLLILRGMDLGIPYISPQLPIEAIEGNGCK